MTIRCLPPTLASRTAVVWMPSRLAACPVSVMRLRSDASTCSTLAGSTLLAAPADFWVHAASWRQASSSNAIIQRFPCRTELPPSVFLCVCVDLAGGQVDLRPAERLGAGAAGPKAQVQRGYDEQAEQRRGDQAAEDDDGHGPHDLAAGLVAEHHQRNQRQRGRQRGRQA